jgi:paraquat-inducible protein B
VGTVRDINLEFDSATGEPRIPILIDLEPERVPESEADPEAQKGFDKQKAQMAINQLVENKGFRGQLATGSLLTGKLFISLDFFPNSKTKKIQMVGDYPEFPTVPTTLDELKTSLTSFLADVNKLPLSEISQNILDTTEGLERLVNDPELLKTVGSANKTLVELDKLAVDLNKKLVPLLSKANKTLGLLGDDSPLSVDLENTLKEFSSAARSIRLTADYLKQNPNSLI